MSEAYTLETAYKFAKSTLKTMYGDQGEVAVPTIISMYQSGSRYVGFHTDKSDYDYIALCLPSKQMMYNGDNIAGKILANSAVDGTKLEVRLVDVRDYIHRLTNSLLQEIQMLYAKTDQVYVVPFSEHNSLVAEEVQDYLHELTKERDSLALLDPERFFHSLFGQMRTHLLRGEKALREEKDWERVVKHGVHVEYMTELIHGVYNGEPLFPMLTYSQLVTDNIVRNRETATEYTANISYKMARQNLDVFVGENKYKSFFRFEAEAHKTENEKKAKELKGTLRDILLGGYGE